MFRSHIRVACRHVSLGEDPAVGSWASAGSLVFPRRYHTATLLPSAEVLVAGGLSGGGYLATAEVFDRAAGTWAATGALTSTRSVLEPSVKKTCTALPM